MIPVDRSLVAAVLDRLIPADDWPSATEAGALGELDAQAGRDHASLWTRTLVPGFAALEAEAGARHGSGFAALASNVQDALLEQVEAAQVLTEWPVVPTLFVETVARLAAECFYGRRDSPAWAMVGYDPAPKRGAGAPVFHQEPRETPFGEIGERYDVVVLGAGAGGGVAAMIAAEAGARVLLVDRGAFLSYEGVGRDHLRNHRLSRYGHNTGPSDDAGPRVHVDSRGREHLVRRAHQPGWLNNAMTVGGGTRVYQGMAWRFMPDDFRLASLHGVPDGSTLADWPLTYDELEPHYTRAEWEVGVCGDGSAHRNQGHRSRSYPMGPLPTNPEARLLARGAERLGWSAGPVPLLINSTPRDGRARCVQCGECVGFACPSDAKNGTHNALIPRALATGRCTLVTRARALRLLTAPDGAVTGVELVDENTSARTSVAAGRVVVACGAIESARLLLASRSDAHPDGIGNRTDQVGRNLQGHLYASVFGEFDDEVSDGEVIDARGPGVSIGVCDFTHGYPGAFGGGALHNECVKLPIIHWNWALPPDLKRWGVENKRAMRDLYRRTSHIYGPIQELPHADSRVTLDPVHRDRHGVPVARTTGPLHSESLRVGALHRDRAVEWLHASGAKRVWAGPLSPEITASQHQAGTCRMGDDPAASVTDRWGRVHGHDNLWVMDGSVHVTNGGFNPVLNIYALAFRNAAAMMRG